MILSSSRISETNLPILIICMCDFVDSLRITYMIRIRKYLKNHDKINQSGDSESESAMMWASAGAGDLRNPI